MGHNWVYRRPYFRVAKPKIPLTRPGHPVPQRRRRFFQRRRHIAHTKAAVAAVLGVAAVQAGVGHVPTRRRRIHLRIPRPQAAKFKIPIPRPFEGKTGVIQRMLKAVARMRRAMQRRLRFRPRPSEIPPGITTPTVHAVPRGEIQSAGAVEGSIYTAGSKRGTIGGDH